jgi:hypothetical protein
MLDPETALKLMLMLLRGTAYFFAGFALLALCTYVVFLYLEIFASQPRAQARAAKVPQPVGCASVVEQVHDLVPAETPTLAEAASSTGEADLSLLRGGADGDTVQPNFREKKTAVQWLPSP